MDFTIYTVRVQYDEILCEPVCNAVRYDEHYKVYHNRNLRHSEKPKACSESVKKISQHISFVRYDIKNLFTTQYSQFTKKVFAFTIAETLIVMGVIGVVAALTLPNLNQSTNNKEKVVRLKKVHKELNEALGRAEAVYGPISTWFNNDSINDNNDTRILGKRAGSRLVDFLKIRKDCGVEEDGCMKPSWYLYRDGSMGEGYFGSGSSHYKFILQDGTAIALLIFNDHGNRCIVHEDQQLYHVGLCGWVYVDLGGPNKGKHMWGSEVFDFYVTTEGILPIGTPMDKYGNSNNNLKENCIKKGFRCAGWVILNDNMDYLKTNSSGECPNGTVLSWENTTCNYKNLFS